MPQSRLDDLLKMNRAWSQGMTRKDPDFFKRLVDQQTPEYLWIGCADSRVPANVVLGLDPGEVFVHRNVANVVVHTDLNCLSVIQYAVEVLKVKHVIVGGHYGCGGVAAALADSKLGLIENWLRHIKDVRDQHRELLDAQPDDKARTNRLCELNVLHQAVNVCGTTFVREAWGRGQEVTVHGVIYDLSEGLLHPLGLEVSGPDAVDEAYTRALKALATS